jgi:hypothetical protein
MKHLLLSIELFILVVSQSCIGQSHSEEEFLNFIKGKDSLIDAIIERPDKYNLQILYSQIDHLNEGRVSINTIDLTANKYFYPASSIKLPCAILTLEKLHQFNIGKDHYFRIDDAFLCGNTNHITSSHELKRSYYDVIRKMLVVSDNQAYNSVYEFLTPEYIEQKLESKNLGNIHIYKKIAGCSITDNLKCNTIVFYNNNNQVIHTQNASVLDLKDMAAHYEFSNDKLIGNSTRRNAKNIPRPFDFNYGIEASLMDLHHALTSLIFPSSVDASHRWDITESDRNFLIKCLGMYPRELNIKEYDDPAAFPDHLLKYIVLGDTKNGGNTNKLRTFSKIGLSYGFFSETAYVVDFEKNIDFFLSISIYINANQTVNDGIYEYEEIAKPFSATLGRLIIEYESEREMDNPPDLTALKSLFD